MRGNEYDVGLANRVFLVKHLTQPQPECIQFPKACYWKSFSIFVFLGYFSLDLWFFCLKQNTVVFLMYPLVKQNNNCWSLEKKHLIIFIYFMVYYRVIHTRNILTILSMTFSAKSTFNKEYNISKISSCFSFHQPLKSNWFS